MPELEPPYVEPLLGIVFDLDGTLILSRHDFAGMRRAVVAAAEAAGLPPGTIAPGATVVATMRAAEDAFRALHRPEPVIDRFGADVHARIDALEMAALPTVTARPGAEPLLAELARREYRLGLLTRSHDGFAREALRRTGLTPYFPFLRTRSAPGPAKPDPDALLLLLKEMEVPRDRALLVGDHVMDAETAVGARVRFYGLLSEPPADPDAPTTERFRAAGAQAVARDLRELGQILGLPPVARPA